MGHHAGMTDTDLSRFAAGANTTPPRHLGIRYDATGRFLEEPGNTVVCHLHPGSAEEQALVALRERMRAMPDADRLAFTPVSSLHMTLFQGIIEYRRTWPYWPRDIAADALIDETTRRFAERLQGFRGAGPFQVQATGLTPNGLIVEGAGEADRRTLAAWRDALAEVFGYRHPDHETYVFHVTLAYPIRWLDDARIPAWQAALAEGLADLQRAVPVMTLRPPAFCRFRDMELFEELVVLA